METPPLNAALRFPWRAVSEAGAILYRSAAGTCNEVAHKLVRLVERYRQRCDLQALDDHMLRDIGLSRGDVDQECGRPFWMD